MPTPTATITRRRFEFRLFAVVGMASAVLTVLALLAPVAGHAHILAPTTIDSSATDIVDLGDVAMAPDATGGLVYRRKCRPGDLAKYGCELDGRNHVFASLFRNGSWSAPVQVDTGQEFESTAPRLAAGPGGRLVAVWVQDGGVNGDRLYSATIDPGTQEFEPPIPVDLDLGSRGKTIPDIAMNEAGQAYVVYRVVTATTAEDPTIPTGFVRAALRAARFNASTWSRFDQLLNRNTATPVLSPSKDNEPRIAIDRFGNGVVAFQEPDDELIGRVWLRRLFGSTAGLPIIASPTSFGGQALRGTADQIALDVGTFGNVAVTFRQAPGNPTALDRTRIFVNLVPDLFSAGAAVAVGARTLDGAIAGGALANGSVAIAPDMTYHALFALNGANRVAGSDTSDPSLTSLDPSLVPNGPFAGVDLTPLGRGASAWVSGATTSQTLAIREEDESGTASVGTTSGLGSGFVAELGMGGSGFGDAIAAGRSTGGGATSILAIGIDAPPSPFLAFESDDWQRERNPVLQWETAYDAFGGVSYEVSLKGRLIGVTAERKLNLRKFARDGTNPLKVTAVDRFGQRRSAREVLLRLDRRKPSASIKRVGGGRVRVIVKDGNRLRSAGVSSRSLVVWGDGKRTRIRSRATHRFSRGRRVLIAVTVRDRAGNKRVLKRRITP